MQTVLDAARLVLVACALTTMGCSSSSGSSSDDAPPDTPIPVAEIVVTPSVVDFGTQTVGSTGTRTITVANEGNAAAGVTSITVSGSFDLAGNPAPGSLEAGARWSIEVTFAPDRLGDHDGSMVIDFDELATREVPLSGAAVESAVVTLDTTDLPDATQDAGYRGHLVASGGSPPYLWSLSSGDTLPAGLSLEPTTGEIYGTPLVLGEFDMTVSVEDAGTPAASDSGTVRLRIRPHTGADCDAIETGFVPLGELGAAIYQGEQGGLYPGGAMARPGDHTTAGLALAQSIEALDASGNPDPAGTYVLLSIGMSNATQEFAQFMELAAAQSDLDPSLVIVDGAQGGWTANRIIDPNAEFWTTVDQRLQAAGAAAAQVQVVWVKQAVGSPSEGFPDHAQTLGDQLAEIARILRTRFPNLKLAYHSSRIYGGYATTTLNPEPFAYETGFSVKWLIEQQLDGDPTLNFDPAQGTVSAPWLSWGPYLWADGLNPRADGLVWTCQDLATDGTHPSPDGQDKVARLLLEFLRSDVTAQEWFLDDS